MTRDKWRGTRPKSQTFQEPGQFWRHKTASVAVGPQPPLPVLTCDGEDGEVAVVAEELGMQRLESRKLRHVVHRDQDEDGRVAACLNFVEHLGWA